MGKDTVIEVVLRLKDQMGGQAKKALADLTQAAKGAGQGAGTAAKAVDGLAKAARSAEQGAGSAGKALGDMGRIGQNCAQTAGAAARATSDLGRAAGAMRTDKMRQMGQDVAKVAQESRTARRELDGAARSGERFASALSRAGRAGSAAWGALKGVGQVGAGLAAGAGVAAAALRKPIEFEKRMTLMANTAYADEKDPAKRLAGRKGLVDAVNAAVRQGGGSRDEAAEALDKMLASGAVKADTAQKLLPTIQKFASASGTGSGDIADIVIRGLQSGFFKEDQATLALDKAMAAGQAGGFELKDMAKWLPKFMAMAPGMKGMGGYEQLLAYAQAAATTAGTKDEAGNNLVNLLQKLNSQDTQKDFKNLGIDLTGTLAKAREKGVLPLEAFGDLVEKQVMGKDKRYQALKKRLESAQGDEKKQILGDMTDLAGASAIGKVVQDRQALLALISAINQKDYIKQVQAGMAGAAGEGERSFDVYKGSTAYSVEKAANEAEIARSGMLSDTSGPLKALADAAADLAQKFPGLATVAMEATTAIGAMTAAAAAFGALRMFSGGGGAAVAAAGGGGLLSAGVSAAGRLGSRAMPWLLAGEAAYDIYKTEANPTLTRAQKNANNMETYGATGGALAGMWGGAALGASVGSVVPVLGTAVGGVLGGALGALGGWWAGGQAGRQTGNYIWGPSPEATDSAKMMATAHQPTTIKNEITVNVDGREVARAVNEHNADQAKRE